MNRIDEVFNDSYERCLAKDNFIDRFYERYIASNEDIARKFSHTDVEQQKTMLKASLHMIMALRLVDAEEAVTYFKRIGVVHGRDHHDIGPELYDLWLTSLMDVVEECDDRYTPEVDNAWRQLLTGGIEIMKSMY